VQQNFVDILAAAQQRTGVRAGQQRNMRIAPRLTRGLHGRQRPQQITDGVVAHQQNPLQGLRFTSQWMTSQTSRSTLARLTPRDRTRPPYGPPWLAFALARPPDRAAGERVPAPRA